MDPSTIRQAAELAKSDPNGAYDLLDKEAGGGAKGLAKALQKGAKALGEAINQAATKLPSRLYYEPFTTVRSVAGGIQIALDVRFPETGSAYQDMPGWGDFPAKAEAAAKNIIGLTLGYDVKLRKTSDDPIMWSGIYYLKP